MKTCPICQALAFDDAERCYGCLHVFAEENALSTFEQNDESPIWENSSDGFAMEADPAEAGSGSSGDLPAPSDEAGAWAVAASGQQPSFVVKVRPEPNGPGPLSWVCSVDVVQPAAI